MTSIFSRWRQYFRNPSEGLGTTYERFILHEHFKKIKNRYAIRSILEAPSFGMTGISGINSVWWAYDGIQTTIIDHNRERIELIKKIWRELSLKANFIYQSNCYTYLPFKAHSFDMGWNFSALWLVPKLEMFLEELARVTKKVIFICIPNRSNVFHLLRLIFRNNPHVGPHTNSVNPKNIKKIMLKFGWQVEEDGYLDVPPWPDIAMKKEDLLYEIGLKRLADRLRNRKGNYVCILDYFSSKKKNMDREILKYGFLEHSPRIFKIFWAHHRYFIFTPIQKEHFPTHLRNVQKYPSILL
jgi:hypothetical protein